MEIIIKTPIVSKKNSRILVHARGRIFSIPSSAFTRFKKAVLLEIGTRKGYSFTGPVKCFYTFYFRGAKELDLDNAVASVNDILEEAKVIKNDSDIREIHAFKDSGYSEASTYLLIEPRCYTWGIWRKTPVIAGDIWKTLLSFMAFSIRAFIGTTVNPRPGAKVLKNFVSDQEKEINKETLEATDEKQKQLD